MDVDQRERDIQAELRRLPDTRSDKKLRGALYVVSLKRRDRYQMEGRVFLVTPRDAAKLIVEGTHELASEAQIREYEVEMNARAEEINAKIVEEKQQFQVVLTPELVAAAQTRLKK